MGHEQEPELVAHECSNKASKNTLLTKFGVSVIRPNKNGRYFLRDQDVTDGNCPICGAKVKTFKTDKTFVNSPEETIKHFKEQRGNGKRK